MAPSEARSVQKRPLANIPQYGSEVARLESNLLYGTRAMFVLNLPLFESKKYTADTVSMETMRVAKS